jgi:hypothetical protein
VQAAYRRRLESLDRPLWVQAMAEILNRRASRQTHFRWHDSGDLQSAAHLAAIVAVCELTPDVKHWLPTREYRIVAQHVAEHGSLPANLNVRLSAHMIGGHVPTFPRLSGHVTVSTVSAEPMAGAYDCPARFQSNTCGDCRACWDRDTPHVDYHLH